MILSIGMIVKNEEKYLDKCLTALSPILSNIDSELIIVDTGSTDKTIEIAKKHTDKVYHFKWCDDFSAARNETLKYSSGEWYMFLDADEILIDAKEIIDFFKSKKYKRFDYGRYEIINYRNDKKTSYAKAFLYRMYKLTPNTKFIGIVHEHIIPSGNEAMLFNTSFEHYGYSFTSTADAKKKSDRNNILLLKEIENGNDRPMIRNQLAESYSMARNFDEAIKHANYGIKLLEKNTENPLNFALYANLMHAYFFSDRFEKIIECSKKYFSYKNTELATDIDVYAFLTLSYFKMNDYESCIESYHKFIDLFNRYNSHKLYTIELNSRALLAADMSFLYKAIYFAANAYIKLERYHDALPLLNDKNLDYNNVDDISPYIGLHLSIMEKQNNYNGVVDLYDSFININSNYKNIFENAVEHFMKLNEESRSSIINVFNLSNYSTQYTEYMKIRFQHEHSINNFVQKLGDFISVSKKFDEKYADLVYYILENNLSLSLLHKKLDCNAFSIIMQNIITKDKTKYFEILKNYSFDAKTLSDNLWLKKLYEISLKYLGSQDYEFCILISEKYLINFNSYVNVMYSINALTDDLANLLPSDIEFGYYYHKAFEYKNINMQTEYVKYLKLALLSNEVYKDIISILLTNLDTPNEKESDPNDEFKQLSNIIKNNIYDLISCNNIDEAINLLNEYIALNPTDSDIDKLKGLLKEKGAVL